jgi:hypothetical protein
MNVRADVRPGWTAARWGDWVVSGTSLIHPSPSGDRLEVNLTRCTSPSAVIDVIAQIVRTNWVSKRCVAGLVFALDEILDLQQSFCGDRWPTKQDIMKRLPP